MRILFVAFPDNIHTSRWISQLKDLDWDIHLLSSNEVNQTHPELQNITCHYTFYPVLSDPKQKVKRYGIPVIFPQFSRVLNRLLAQNFPWYPVWRLKRVITKIKPDIVHTLEMQSAGYLTADAKAKTPDFPIWIATNWGSDIYLYQHIKSHEAKLRQVLALCDYYSCECERDVKLAKLYGLKGNVLPVFPNTGGFDFNLVASLSSGIPPSQRRMIMLKGYQSITGRALTALRALERASDVLNGYQICIYLAKSDVILAAQLFESKTGIPVSFIPFGTSHQHMLRLHGQARISIGVGISDGVSTSFLEAMVMGAFPIQSWTACAEEWVDDGESGVLVPPEDPEVIELAIRKAIGDDELVDRAQKINQLKASDRLDSKMLKPLSISFYHRALGYSLELHNA